MAYSDKSKGKNSLRQTTVYYFKFKSVFDVKIVFLFWECL